MGWIAKVPPRLGTQDHTGMCLRFAQSFFGAPVRYASAWQAWQHVQAKYSPSDALPPVPVLLWFEHWGTYGAPPTYGNWGHVAIHVPGDAIYTSPAWGYGQGRYATIAQIEASFNARYVGWSPDINGLFVADYVSDKAPVTPPRPKPKPIPVQEDDMSKPLLAMKLDGKEMNGLGVMYDPDGAVTALTPAQWDFWRDRVGCVPVQCKNPGHWEYLSQCMEKRRKRAGITVSAADIKKIADTVKDTVTGVTAEKVAASLAVTVKPGK